ncbi:MAG: NAD(P)H-binding protein [Bryobacterales bacterium]|nr:NAD(P)H-binding protein [Bryobacterales bacterium]
MAEALAAPMPNRVLILGCGYTGIRVARTLLEMGVSVVATTRDPAGHFPKGMELHRFDALRPEDLRHLSTFVEDCEAVICSIPTLRVENHLVERVPALVRAIREKVSRFVYLSTTGIYGDQHLVDATTLPAPATSRERLRVEAEEAVLAGFDSPLVLRPAAIYGPWRGVHVSIREGRYRLTGDGSNYVSRIHVDDLAAHVVASLGSHLQGAWPLADERACTQREMAEFCAELLGLPVPASADPGSVSETLRANRRVDGAAIRARLQIRLRYPSYREGVPASIAAEAGGFDQSR